MTRYLSWTEVVALHIAVMERLGMAPAPLRDEGRLQAAVMRPQMAAHYEEADIIQQAVLLAVGILQAQAFLDGNKRTAFAACDVFLRINGYLFDGDPIELAQQLEIIAQGSHQLDTVTEQVETWLRARAVKID